MGLPWSVNLYLNKYSSKAGTSPEEQGLEASLTNRLACDHLENGLDILWILHKKRPGALLEYCFN